MNASAVPLNALAEGTAAVRHTSKYRRHLCSTCGGDNHNRRSCPKFLLAQRRRPYTCHYCGENGHPASRCSVFFSPVLFAPLPTLPLQPGLREPLKRKQGQVLALAEKRIALHVLLKLIQEGATNVFETASKYTGISVKTLRVLHQEYHKNGDIQEDRCNRGQYGRDLHWSRHWITNIRETVLRLNARGIPATIGRIKSELDLPEYGLQISNTTMRRILKEIGFRFRNTGNAQNFLETRNIAEWRKRYLQERINTRVLVERGDVYEVWLDESYCNQYHVANWSWFRDGDSVKRGNKGRKWIIVHAGGRDGWCGIPCVFSGSSGGDYHDSMNGEVFEEYLQSLCESLLNRSGPYQQVIFYMDNAKYHKRIDGLPRSLSCLSKSELKTWLSSKGAKTKDIEKLNRKELYELARDNPSYKGTPSVERIVGRYGFRIEWLPPYHPSLNPIEEAWGIAKGYVANNNDGASFSKVKDLIFEGFSKVTPEVWAKLVRRTYTNEDALIEKFCVPMVTQLSDMVIDLDTDSEYENDGLQPSKANYKELTFDDAMGREAAREVATDRSIISALNSGAATLSRPQRTTRLPVRYRQ